MSKGFWRSLEERLTGRSDVNEPGVGRGKYSGNDGHVKNLNENGLTDRQEELVQAFIAAGHSSRRAARELGVSRALIDQALRQVGRRLDVDNGSNVDIADAYAAHVGFDVNEYGRTDQGQNNHDDQSVAGGDHPWLYDSEGNYIG